MEEIIPKEELDRLMKIPGEVREIALRNHKDFILKEKGDEGLKKLEEVLNSFECIKERGKLKSWEFYPIGLEIIELLVIKRIFDFPDEKIKEIGAFGSRVSFIVKLFFRYIGSIKLLAKEAPKIWRKYYTTGDLVIKETNEEKKYIIVAVNNFNVHPIHCLHLSGYFSNMVKIVSGGKTISCEETKCTHRGDEYHEFLIKWQ